MKMGPIICPEKSLKNYHYPLRYNQEERSSLILREGSLQSRRFRPFPRLSTSGSYFTALENSECQIAFFDFLHACNCFSHKYRVSQEEWTKLRESVPYVKLYRYTPKHLYPKLNGYGDNGQRSLKL